MSIRKYIWQLVAVLIITTIGTTMAQAKQDTISYRIYFPVGKSNFVPTLRNNKAVLDSLLSLVRHHKTRGTLHSVHLFAGASPEGSVALNWRLSDARLQLLRHAVRNAVGLPDSLFILHSLGEDYDGLRALVSRSDMPDRDAVLDIIDRVPLWVTENGKVIDSRKRQLQRLQGGRAWDYMLRHFFPDLRGSSLIEVLVENHVVVPAEEPNLTAVPKFVVDSVGCIEPLALTPRPEESKWLVGLKTNTLYDLALVPNIGFVASLGKGWALQGDWMYAWWHNDKRHYYWRLYGGEIGLRKYFTPTDAPHPLTGFFAGVYGQMFTYDFELGGKGYIGGKPHGTLWDQPYWAAGIEAGYSMPLSQRLHLDFALGMGYATGTYHEYHSVGPLYIWDSTSKQHWVGPTKAEISLVWLLGNVDRKKKKKN